MFSRIRRPSSFGPLSRERGGKVCQTRTGNEEEDEKMERVGRKGEDRRREKEAECVYTGRGGEERERNKEEGRQREAREAIKEGMEETSTCTTEREKEGAFHAPPVYKQVKHEQI